MNQVLRHNHRRKFTALLSALLTCLLFSACSFSNLHMAVSSNNMDLVKVLLEQGDKPESFHLMSAISNGNQSMVQLLLEKGANAKDGCPLAEAAYHGRTEIVESLLSFGATVNCGNKAGVTPLMWAAEKGKVDMARLLIDRGADVNHRCNAGCTALVSASVGGNVEITKMLLERGAKVDVGCSNGNNALLKAAYGGHTDIVRALVSSGATVECRNQAGMTPLMWAAEKGKVDMARLLIDRGANVNAKTDDGFIALMNAAVANNASLEMVQLFIQKGVDINHRSKYDFTAFSVACQCGNAEAAISLYEKGADPNLPDRWVETNGKIHHILGDYFLSLDQVNEAQASYKKAKDYYDRTVQACKAKDSLRQLGMAVLGGIVQGLQSYGSSYQARIQSRQSRQFAEISALRHAEKAGTGIQGFNAYMAKYKEPYIPTYSTVSLKPIPYSSVNSMVVQFQDLSALMERVLKCFDDQTDGTNLHSCVVTRAKESSSTK